MPTAGTLSASMGNNITFLSLLKPTIFPNAFASAAASYDNIQTFIEQMNPNGSVSVDDTTYQFGFYSPIMNALTSAANGTLTSQGFLELPIANPNNQDLGNIYRKWDLVRDGNHITGQVEQVISGTQTLIIRPLNVAAFDPTIHFYAGSEVVIYGNAMPEASNGIDSLTNSAELITANIQFMREQHTVDQVTFKKPTWVTWEGKFWRAKDIYDMKMRYKKKIAYNDLYGTAKVIGTGRNAVRTYEGIREAIINRSKNYFPRTSEMTENDFQDILQLFVQNHKSGALGDEIVCSLGIGALKVMQRLFRTYVVNAGVLNTFGGYKVEGINIEYYKIFGYKVWFVHSPIFDDPTQNKELTSIDTGLKSSYTWFLHVNKQVMGSNGMEAPITKHHWGSREQIPFAVRGAAVAPETISPSLTGLEQISSTMSITDLSTDFTVGIFGSRSLKINPESMAWIEYTV